MVEKLKVLPFTNKDTSVKESILILDRNHKDKVNALPINLKLSRFMTFLNQNFTIERDLKRHYFVSKPWIPRSAHFSKKKFRARNNFSFCWNCEKLDIGHYKSCPFWWLLVVSDNKFHSLWFVAFLWVENFSLFEFRK